ncbi:hypothetical protein E3N88_28552 [Mikania micrantha]|uniref:Uncharacterized protein n=1 Tax=Mikania micrantha TaxID=192012 RepID=A0A5N6N0C4_9ASTR|nr:hypothetical protein E3N88_28552 [Mikania micrantha]
MVRCQGRPIKRKRRLGFGEPQMRNREGSDWTAKRETGERRVDRRDIVPLRLQDSDNLVSQCDKAPPILQLTER